MLLLIRDLFQKIVSDFPIIILTTQPIKNAEQAFDLSEILDESLVSCDDNAIGFYPKKFTNWLQLIDADTTYLPEYSYLNYVDYLGELILIDESNYENFDFHQMVIIVGDVGDGILGKDFYTINNDQMRWSRKSGHKIKSKFVSSYGKEKQEASTEI
jgi:hypothetical protein